jgi:hypothetical protein
MSSEKLLQFIAGMLTDEDKKNIDAYMMGKGDPNRISQMAVSGITTKQMSGLNNVLNEYCKEAFPDKAKNFDAVKAKIDDHLEKLGPGADPGWWEIIIMLAAQAAAAIPVAVQHAEERHCWWWQFWCWW